MTDSSFRPMSVDGFHHAGHGELRASHGDEERVGGRRWRAHWVFDAAQGAGDPVANDSGTVGSFEVCTACLVVIVKPGRQAGASSFRRVGSLSSGAGPFMDFSEKLHTYF